HSTASPDPYTLSLHDALPISRTNRFHPVLTSRQRASGRDAVIWLQLAAAEIVSDANKKGELTVTVTVRKREEIPVADTFNLESIDRKSTRLNSSHVKISYAVF